MAFAVICALLIVLALAFILPPLRHPDRITSASTATEANVAVYRRQLAEMEAALRQQLITNDEFLQDREDLERRLIGDLPNEIHARRNQRPVTGPGMLAPVLAAGVPLSAILLYLLLGAPPPLG
jgi:cytochrome c-type biogenesis protein CcmI